MTGQITIADRRAHAGFHASALRAELGRRVLDAIRAENTAEPFGRSHRRITIEARAQRALNLAYDRQTADLDMRMAAAVGRTDRLPGGPACRLCNDFGTIWDDAYDPAIDDYVPTEFPCPHCQQAQLSEPSIAEIRASLSADLAATEGR
jgi:hypothetical protein